MNIKKLVLKDFRCFDEFEIEFDQQYNVHAVVAENMLGKSAIMGALKLAANTYTSGLQSESQQLQQSDHRVIGNNPLSDIATDVSVQVTADIVDVGSNTVECIWKKYQDKPKGGRTKIQVIQGINPQIISKNVNREVAEKSGIQPLMSFVGTEYIHVPPSLPIAWDLIGKSIDGYLGCFANKSIQRFLFRWIERIDGIISEMGRKPLIAETYKNIPHDAMAVFKKAVVSVLEDIVEIDWSVDAKQPIVRFENGDIRLFSMLSDGYRYLILLAGELATRSFILNKHLGITVLEKVHGLVIIDEFGIHLHPSLQNNAMIRLCQTFPNVQFIISTHSPLLLNGFKKEQVHILSINKDGKRTATHPDEDIVGLGANEILTKIFGLPTTMDHQFLEWNDEYTALFKKKSEQELSSGEMERFKELSERLAPLRLDPELKLTIEDPITTIVKEQLESRANEVVFSISDHKALSGDIEKRVGNILESFFKPSE